MDQNINENVLRLTAANYNILRDVLFSSTTSTAQKWNKNVVWGFHLPYANTVS